MRSAPLLLHGVICLALMAPAAAQYERRREPSTDRGHYFIDFRARGGGAIGHTYIIYGRADAQGRIIEQRHASHYPDDAWEESPALAVVLVPGYISSKLEDPRKPQVASYRRRLTSSEYAHLQLTVQRLRAMRPAWHMTFYNCNDFAAQVARELGMVAPLSWVLPGTFIASLRAINGD